MFFLYVSEKRITGESQTFRGVGYLAKRVVRKKDQLQFIGVVEKDTSRIKIYPEFCEGIEGLKGYSHIIVLYWFHQRDSNEERKVLKVVPRKHPGAPEVGVFSSRSPSRPNPIGFCVAELQDIKDCTLIVSGLDAFEGSPIIDIKPYLPKADSIPDAKVPEWTRHGLKT
jgi:tRNA-Thr(GGU) m(6)t(6)A37 methyltransferase TsaA